MGQEQGRSPGSRAGRELEVTGSRSARCTKDFQENVSLGDSLLSLNTKATHEQGLFFFLSVQKISNMISCQETLQENITISDQ